MPRFSDVVGGVSIKPKYSRHSGRTLEMKMDENGGKKLMCHQPNGDGSIRRISKIERRK